MFVCLPIAFNFVIGIVSYSYFVIRIVIYIYMYIYIYIYITPLCKLSTEKKELIIIKAFIETAIY